jgi:arylsulfatase A-like enzyme
MRMLMLIPRPRDPHHLCHPRSAGWAARSGGDCAGSVPSLAVLVLALGALGCGGADQPRRPNVVLISIDMLRPDHLGCHGYERDTSPSIDRLAREGVRFAEHVSSAPWTLPAHTAMFTSVPDSVHGVVDPIGTALAPGFVTLAERLQDAGYATGGVFAGPYLHPAFGLGQGFDRYVDRGKYLGDVDLDAQHEWSMNEAVMRASHHGVTNEDVYASTRSFLEEHAGKRPFFAFVHLWDVHFDFTPPPPYDKLFDPDYTGPITGRDFFFDPAINAAMPERDREHLIALYDGEIRWTDEVVGRIRADLERLGLAEDTLVIITSDHGTELFDHGQKGHRTTLYDEQLRIPLVLWFPARLAPRVVDTQTRMIDLAPTILDLVDLGAPDGWLGESLVPLADGAPLGFDNVAVSELMSVGRELRSVRTKEAKLVVDTASGGSAWWDLAADPYELEPLEVDASPQATALTGLYARIVAELSRAIEARPAAPGTPALSEAIRRSLAASGYVGSGQ